MVKNISGREVTLKEMKSCVGEGWGKLIEEIYDLCDEYNIIVYQIKEKYGGLRVYTSGGPDQVLQAILNIQERSLHICEECGAPGSLKSSNGWLKARCQNH